MPLWSGVLERAPPACVPWPKTGRACVISADSLTLLMSSLGPTMESIGVDSEIYRISTLEFAAGSLAASFTFAVFMFLGFVVSVMILATLGFSYVYETTGLITLAALASNALVPDRSYGSLPATSL